MDVTPIDCENETNRIYMNNDVNVVNIYYVPFLFPNSLEDVSTVTKYDSEKRRVLLS